MPPTPRSVDVGGKDAEPAPSVKSQPFFLNELILQDNRLISVPSEDRFTGGIANLVSRFQVGLSIIYKCCIPKFA